MARRRKWWISFLMWFRVPRIRISILCASLELYNESIFVKVNRTVGSGRIWLQIVGGSRISHHHHHQRQPQQQHHQPDERPLITHRREKWIQISSCSRWTNGRGTVDIVSVNKKKKYEIVDLIALRLRYIHSFGGRNFLKMKFSKRREREG